MTEHLRVIQVKRLPEVWRFLIPVLIALAGLFLIRSGDTLLVVIGWGWLLGAGYIAAVLLGKMLRPASLVLSGEGFQTTGFRQKAVVRWSDVDRFWVLRTPKGAFALYALKDQPERRAFGMWVFRGLPSEADGYFSPLLEVKPDALVGLLDDWKARHGG